MISPIFTSYPYVRPQEKGKCNSMTGSTRGLLWLQCAMPPSPHRFICLNTWFLAADAAFEGYGTSLGGGALLGDVGHWP